MGCCASSRAGARRCDSAHSPAGCGGTRLRAGCGVTTTTLTNLLQALATRKGGLFCRSLSPPPPPPISHLQALSRLPSPLPSWSVIRRHVPLYFLTQFFDYLGSIINYAAVGGAILYLSKAEGMGEAEIAALVARGSYSCLYLIDAFSQVRLRRGGGSYI